MTRTRVSARAVLVAASLAGCAGTGDVEYAGEVHVTSPDLVQISPGVQVIADADEPIFYTSGDYWLYRDGYWLRSGDYRSGYARVEYHVVPQELRAIPEPQLYVHYRQNAERIRAARAGTMRTRSRPTPLAPEQQQMPAEEKTQSSEPSSATDNRDDRDDRTSNDQTTQTQKLDEQQDKQKTDE